MLSLVIALAAVLRFAHLGSKSIWADEAFSVWMARAPWSGFWHVLTATEANMSLYYLLLRAWIQFGDPAWWVRVPSALAGIAIVPVVYYIGRDIFSRTAGMLAAFLVAISAIAIESSQDARSYSLFIFLISISFLAFFKLTRRPVTRWNICYVLATVFALYAHFFAALALLVQIVAVLVAPNRRQVAKPLFVCFSLILILASPLAWFVLFRNRGQLSWIQPVHGKDLYHFFLYLVGSGVRFAIAAISFLVALGVSISRRRKRGWDFEAWSFSVVVLWLFLPVSITLLVSVWKPIYVPRFLIFCLPAAMLFIADGLAKIRYRWLSFVLVVVFTIACIGPVRRYYADPGHEDWKSAVEFLLQNAGTGATVYVPEPYCATPLNYALEHARPTAVGLHVDTLLPSISPIWMIQCSVAKDFSRPPSAISFGPSADFSRQPPARIVAVTTFRGVRIIELR